MDNTNYYMDRFYIQINYGFKIFERKPYGGILKKSEIHKTEITAVSGFFLFVQLIAGRCGLKHAHMVNPNRYTYLILIKRNIVMYTI